jgi:hypothetical protein
MFESECGRQQCGAPLYESSNITGTPDALHPESDPGAEASRVQGKKKAGHGDRPALSIWHKIQGKENVQLETNVRPEGCDGKENSC